MKFLQERASHRARLFAERYENAVVGLAWPLGVGVHRERRLEGDNIAVSPHWNKDLMFEGGGNRADAAGVVRFPGTAAS